MFDLLGFSTLHDVSIGTTTIRQDRERVLSQYEKQQATTCLLLHVNVQVFFRGCHSPNLPCSLRRLAYSQPKASCYVFQLRHGCKSQHGHLATQKQLFAERLRHQGHRTFFSDPLPIDLACKRRSRAPRIHKIKNTNNSSIKNESHSDNSNNSNIRKG